MPHLAILMLASLAVAGPNGLQVLHSPAAEQVQQRMMADRLGSIDAIPVAPRRVSSSPADPKAAAWRADHLTCANHKGRTEAQYQAECAAWAAGQAAREADR